MIRSVFILIFVLFGSVGINADVEFYDEIDGPVFRLYNTTTGQHVQLFNGAHLIIREDSRILGVVDSEEDFTVTITLNYINGPRNEVFNVREFYLQDILPTTNDWDKPHQILIEIPGREDEIFNLTVNNNRSFDGTQPIIANRGYLFNLIQYANALDPSLFTPASWQRKSLVLTEAMAIESYINVDQEVIDYKTEALYQAISQLELIEVYKEEQYKEDTEYVEEEKIYLPPIHVVSEVNHPNEDSSVEELEVNHDSPVNNTYVKYLPETGHNQILIGLVFMLIGLGVIKIKVTNS